MEHGAARWSSPKRKSVTRDRKRKKKQQKRARQTELPVDHVECALRGCGALVPKEIAVKRDEKYFCSLAHILNWSMGLTATETTPATHVLVRNKKA